MAKPNPKPKIDRSAYVADTEERIEAQPQAERLEPRRARSKRGLSVGVATSQVCFRIEAERHRALKVRCAQEGLEVGEYLDRLLRAEGL